MSNTSQLYAMVEKYINNNNLNNTTNESQQRVIKSYIKKNTKGNYCIYDNDYYINIVFGSGGDVNTDYDGYILKTDKFHLDTLIYLHPETKKISANVVLFVGVFEIDYSKKLNKEFSPKNINSCRELNEALTSKARFMFDSNTIPEIRECLSTEPYSFLCGEKIQVKDLDRYFYAEGKYKANFHFTGVTAEDVAAMEKEENNREASMEYEEPEPSFESYEQFQRTHSEMLSQINLQDFQKFRFYYEYKEIMKKHQQLES